MEAIIREFNLIKARRDILQESIDKKTKSVGELKEKVGDQIKARWVITEVAQQTQQRFKVKVESLVTMAIRSVFDRPFEFSLEFERKYNKMTCRPVVKEEEKIYDDPEYDLGGGMLDIISFAFRIVLWSLENPRKRNVIILDEPMKNMGKLIVFGGQVLKEISHKLNLQLIIITHEDELLEIGDRNFRITHDGVRSHINVVGGEDVTRPTESKPARRRIAR
jgi:DNA repair exonuclease SbcCD ATPase subunit